MRAVVLRGGKLEVRETPDPVPGQGELLLRVLSTAVCASDVHFMDHSDRIPARTGSQMVYDADRDLVLGHEFVGEVVGHGPGCSEAFPPGTRATSIPIRLVDGGAAGVRVIGQNPDAQGSFAELVVVSEVLARAVPDTVASDAACLVDAFAVGEFYVRSARLEPGEVPVVVGAGAIGLSAVAALVARGAGPVVVSDRKPERLELARAYGAAVTVDPGEREVYDVWHEVATEAGTMQPPVVFECVGAPGMVQRLVSDCPMGTRIYSAGSWYTGDALDCTLATHQGVTVQFGGGPQPQDWYGTLDAMAEGRLDPLPSVGRVVGLEEVPEVLDQVRRSEGPPRVVVHPQGV